MSQYQEFVFKGYGFDQASKTLTLRYGYDQAVQFTETYRFDFDFAQYDADALDRACRLLFLMAGVSYYKAYLPPKIGLGNLQISPAEAKFLSKTYQKGLGEFFYVNQLDPNRQVDFPATASALSPPANQTSSSGLLIGLGGGKDSLVSAEFLRDQAKVATWSLNHRPQLEPLVKRVGLPHFWVERQWDQGLLEHNKNGAYNGHVPISAIFAVTGAVVAILSGYQDVVVSNESSASEPNLHYQGQAINHQYSKSLEFEQDFQQLLAQLLGSQVRYYSFLRPLSELRIAELFSKAGFAKYHDVFSSCNQAFTHTSDHLFWDGTCPKCTFVFLALTPFVERQQLETLFSGKNLLLDPSLEPTYRQLLGIEGNKPLECVGEVKESRAAMELAKKTYPELANKYQYELTAGYDYKQLSAHNMPAEIYAILQQRLT